MKIICHGDSLTEGRDIEKEYVRTSLLSHNLRIPVLNLGISGDTTAGMLSRLPLDVVQQQPNIVIFMGGTNDLWWNLDLNLIKANVAAMVYQIKYHGIAPVIGLPLPIWIEKARAQEWNPPDKGYEHLSSRINEFTEVLKTLADHWDVPVLDFHHLFLYKQGTVNTSLFLEDGVHAAKEGQRMMGIYAAERIKDVFYF
ncbi:MAG: GDSL-type esterase/lipase family protein [Thermodesulfobacteriota bacterium]|nr:GDSL-type esterase/lipase family protein [Thermodesulfobacteriota bacterium]